jgi:hypothetical protein
MLEELNMTDITNKMLFDNGYHKVAEELFKDYIDVYFPHYEGLTEEQKKQPIVKMAMMLAVFAPIRILNGGKRVFFWVEGNAGNAFIPLINAGGSIDFADAVVIINTNLSGFGFFDILKTDEIPYYKTSYFKFDCGLTLYNSDKKTMQAAFEVFDAQFYTRMTKKSVITYKYTYDLTNGMSLMRRLCSLTEVREFESDHYDVSTYEPTFAEVKLVRTLNEDAAWYIVHGTQLVRGAAIAVLNVRTALLNFLKLHYNPQNN